MSPCAPWCRFLAEQPVNGNHHHKGGRQPDQRRQHDEKASVNGHLPGISAHVETACPPMLKNPPRHGRSGVTSNNRVRRTGGQAEPPGEQIPDDGAQNARQDYVKGHDVRIHEPLSDRGCHAGAEGKSRNKIEKCRPRNRLPRRKHSRFETMVAIEFAESWNPFIKSKINANAMMMTTRVMTGMLARILF